mgnify:CR=1 FL=1
MPRFIIARQSSPSDRGFSVGAPVRRLDDVVRCRSRCVLACRRHAPSSNRNASAISRRGRHRRRRDRQANAAAPSAATPLRRRVSATLRTAAVVGEGIVALADRLTADAQDELFQFGIDMCLRGIRELARR